MIYNMIQVMNRLVVNSTRENFYTYSSKLISVYRFPASMAPTAVMSVCDSLELAWYYEIDDS